MGEKTFNCIIQKKFQYFSNIIFYIFHEVLNSLLYLQIKIINLPTKDDT